MFQHKSADGLTQITIKDRNGDTDAWIEICISEYGSITFQSYVDGRFSGCEKQLTGEDATLFVELVTRSQINLQNINESI